MVIAPMMTKDRTRVDVPELHLTPPAVANYVPRRTLDEDASLFRSDRAQAPVPYRAWRDSVTQLGEGVEGSATSSWSLAGILWSSAPMAIIENHSTGRSELVVPGSEVEGLSVQDITRDSIMILDGGERWVLGMSRGGR